MILPRVPESNLPLVNLTPGQLYCAREPTLLTTILGSCVAVCLWDGERGIGGMNHFVLPYERPGLHNARCGPIAMRQLISGLLDLGARMPMLRAKLFGGAAVLRVGPNGANIGSENVRVAIASLRDHHIPIMACRTGGQRGMAIRFVTSTGEVLARGFAGVEAAEP